MSSTILDGLDPQQRAAAEAVEGAVVIRAGAGSGKTRTITHRIAYACAVEAHHPRSGLALTFTNRAAGEMRSRLGELGVAGVQVRTFHSAALRQLRHFWPRVVNGPLPRIAPRSDGLFEQAAASANLTFEAGRLRSVTDAIESLRLQRHSASTIEPDMLGSLDVDAVDAIRLWRAYDQVKTDTGVLDFTDVLEVTSGLFSVHPELLREVHRTYTWFTVDEYQDVSPLQWDLLRAWRGEREQVCVVGDANQTIYGFAGATPSYLLQFTDEFPNAESFELTNCYRSTPQIVQRANALMSSAPTFLELTSRRSPGEEPDISVFTDDAAEARGVAEQIANRITAGIDPRQIAVLFRTNAQSAAIEMALADRGVAVVLRGGDRFFERPEVKEALLRLRMAPASDAPVADTVPLLLTEMGWSEQIPSGAHRARWESLATIIAMAKDARWSSIAAFVDHLAERARVEFAPAPFGVTLSTLHASKGLEWGAVYLIGCSEGLLPLDGADIDEERRLAYVGMTRASNALHISWATKRHAGSTQERVGSRFFTGQDDWAPHAMEPAAVTPTMRPQRRGPACCRVCGRALTTASERTVLRCSDCPTTIDLALATTLTTWRTAVAQARGVPQFQVLTDAAITAIAERRPTDITALMDIPGTRWLGEEGSAVIALVDESRHPLDEH